MATTSTGGIFVGDRRVGTVVTKALIGREVEVADLGDDTLSIDLSSSSPLDGDRGLPGRKDAPGQADRHDEVSPAKPHHRLSAPHRGASLRDMVDRGRGHPGASIADRARHGAHHPATAAQAVPSAPVSGTLRDQRSRFANELEADPQLRIKLKRIMANEQGTNAAGTQAIAESAMNRAIVRGTSLGAQLTWHQGGRGYYAEGSMGRGAVENPHTNAMLERGISGALAGSNLAQGATDNASGGLAAREQASGAFVTRAKINGETFSRPGTAESALASRWQYWHSGIEASEAAATSKAFADVERAAKAAQRREADFRAASLTEQRPESRPLPDEKGTTK
ncbi:hypothetical protein [Bradyrhizobium sp. HKCCYLS3013]|uniref:hypothetical protein n=1 Tax=Bradyrhizobium sp. HKCCYLS3013 TaxID=3420735 RepID=UPI003EC00C05